eukprot:176188-Prymnesium_polylepis.2
MPRPRGKAAPSSRRPEAEAAPLSLPRTFLAASLVGVVVAVLRHLWQTAWMSNESVRLGAVSSKEELNVHSGLAKPSDQVVDCQRMLTDGACQLEPNKMRRHCRQACESEPLSVKCKAWRGRVCNSI